MSNKFLRVTMPDGSEWDVNVEVIAKDYAAYHAKRDSERHGDDYDTVYRDEFNFIMSNAGEDVALDYARNNMDWSELGAVMVKPPVTPDYAQLWGNADYEFVIEEGE